MSLPLLCTKYGTTDARSPAWQMKPEDPICRILASYTTPVYHVEVDYDYDMDGSCGPRRPVLDGLTAYIWTTDLSGVPVCRTYTARKVGKKEWSHSRVSTVPVWFSLENFTCYNEYSEIEKAVQELAMASVKPTHT